MSDATSVTNSTRALGNYFSRVGYVTDDLDATGRSFCELVGVPSFSSREIQVKCAGQQSSAELRMRLGAGAIGPHGEFEVELMEPIYGNSILTHFLERSGAGVHHIGFKVPGYDAFAAPLLAQGPPLMEYSAGNRRGAFFSCAPLGAIIEIAEESADWPSAPHAAEGGYGNSLAAYFMQVAYIVRDLGAAQRWLGDSLGIHDFETSAMFQRPALN